MEADKEFDRTAVHDLIANDSFLRWVTQPSEELDAHWKDVIAKKPKLEKAVQEAKWLIQQMQFLEHKPGAERRQMILNRIRDEVGINKSLRKKVLPIRRWLQAVAILSVVTLSGMWIYTQYMDKPVGGLVGSTQVMASTKEGALFLSNGRNISLADLKPGAILEEGTTRVTLTESNRLIFQYGTMASGVRVDSVISPVGRLLQMELPDGSNLWLNSGSTIRLAGDYNYTDRRVNIDGQGYFEITANADKPFSVSFDDVEVTVLGTQFDVSNYRDAPKVVTLLEGSVRVGNDEVQPRLLRPGQQMLYKTDGSEPTVSEVDALRAVAWKNGIFAFQDDPIENVMRQVGTWYGVEILYEGARPEQTITGTIPRDISLEEALSVLKGTGSDVFFRVSNGQVVVTKKN